MVLLSVREIHDVKTLNSELRSNSQLSACILYGRKNDLPTEVFSAPVRGYSPLSHFCSHSSARMPDLVSEVDSDRRAARASRAWPLPGSGARARASGFAGRA